MFIAILFTIAKIWKQPKCPYIDEVIKKMCNTYTMEYYSVKKKKRMKFCIFSNMDGLGGFMLTEVSQKKTNIVCFHLHMEKKINECNKTDWQVQRTNPVVTSGERAGETDKIGERD